MANVTFDHVMKQFKGRGKEGLVAAVNDLSIEVKDKEFLVLVGPSGCGKTTALRLLAGLEEITAGNIYDRRPGCERRGPERPRHRDGLPVYALYPHMSVYDNMAFGLKLRKTPKDDIDAASRKQPTFWTSACCCSASQRNCPAASASVSRWDAPSCASRRSS